jgi:tRNA (mo5U34)-methyltransferase
MATTRLAVGMKSRRLLRWLGRGRPAGPYQGGQPGLDGGFEDIDWYQTIELGTEVTPGFVDHRDQIQSYRLPESLAGKRCLDVATADGFWAFEMERRGAAEVVATDVHNRAHCDHLTNFESEYISAAQGGVSGRGFAYAHRALASRVNRHVLNAYELTPDRVGLFDLVFISDLLIHLREPLKALEAAWTVLRPGGQVIVGEMYDPFLGEPYGTPALRYVQTLDTYAGTHWWLPNPPALNLMLRHARFDGVEEVTRFKLRTRRGDEDKIVFHAWRRS